MGQSQAVRDATHPEAARWRSKPRESVFLRAWVITFSHLGVPQRATIAYSPFGTADTYGVIIHPLDCPWPIRIWPLAVPAYRRLRGRATLPSVTVPTAGRAAFWEALI